MTFTTAGHECGPYIDPKLAAARSACCGFSVLTLLFLLLILSVPPAVFFAAASIRPSEEISKQRHTQAPALGLSAPTAQYAAARRLEPLDFAPILVLTREGVSTPIAPIAGAALHAAVPGAAFGTARPCRATCLHAQQNDGFDPRFGWFGLELGFVLADAAKQAVRGKTIVGDLVIAGTDNDALKIRQSQSYVLRRIYWQGVDDAGSVRQVDAEALDDPCPAAGYEQYLSLYSPRFHRESGARP